MRRLAAALLVATLALMTVPSATATGVTFCDDGGVTVTVGSTDVVTCYGPDNVFRAESCHHHGVTFVVLDGLYQTDCLA